MADGPRSACTKQSFSDNNACVNVALQDDTRYGIQFSKSLVSIWILSWSVGLMGLKVW